MNFFAHDQNGNIFSPFLNLGIILDHGVKFKASPCCSHQEARYLIVCNCNSNDINTHKFSKPIY